MIVYREQQTRALTADLLDRIDRASGIDVLIQMGEFEAAVADTLAPGHASVAEALRSATLAAARGRVDTAPLRSLALPATVDVPVSEGYAYYAVDPEQYRRSALRYHEERRPERVGVIGIRSIGTSLSAVVAAELAGRGCEVRSWTVRPEGHPWDRRLSLPPALAREWSRMPGWGWAVVDEGPGMSGTSFAAVAEALAGLGVDDERIALFPSWDADGGSFVSERARERWRRHRRYPAGFEFPYAAARDVASGKWREILFSTRDSWPAVQPQHERRKYLLESRLYKFAGYGRYGDATLARARALAAEGFGPPVDSLECGFTVSPWLAGTPAPPVTDELLDRVAAYLACVRRAFPARRAVPLSEMIAVNVSEAFGAEPPREEDCPEYPVYCDGRMLAHEWLAYDGRYIKTDGCDHADDHFYPGPQDIAWDVAAAEVELGANCVAERYARISGDRGVARRLPFYRKAYLAFRLGYADMAAGALHGSDDGERFAGLRRRYASMLRKELDVRR